MKMDKTECDRCGKPMNSDEAIYATKYGFLTVTYGEPYCDACLPDEVEKKCKCCGMEWQDAEDDLKVIIIKFPKRHEPDYFAGFTCPDCGMDVKTGDPIFL